ncbi:uncharacterized protein LOC143920595 [Arctopsyche grandis]|uniref:uncharacterized protein LOC143920595 n=1 Tax=Arctopsyche grandis TaxID=121162 RepID=UPI00406DA331
MTTHPTNFNFENQFDWPLLDICGNKHLTEAAVCLGRLFSEFNDISKSYHLLLSEKETSQLKYDKLYDSYKKLESCENCALLERRLNSQNEKFKELERKVIRNVKYEPSAKLCSDKSPDFATQIKKEIEHTDIFENTPDKVWEESQKHPFIDDDLTLVKTPTKNHRMEKDHTGEINETVIDEQTSPILRKCKLSRINKSKSNTSMKRKEEKQWKSKHPNTPNKENDNIDLSPSLLSSSTETDHNVNVETLTCTAIDNTFEFTTEAVLETKSKKRKKLDLSFTTSQKKNKCLANKNLKQSRLTFKNTKPKLSLDITTTEGFLGGMRNSPNTYISEQSDETSEKDFKTSKKASSSKANVDVDVDSISESPSCISHKPLKVKKVEEINLAAEALFHRETSNSSMIIEDDDETMLFTLPENIRLRKSDTPPDSKKPKMTNLKLTPLKEQKQTTTSKSPIPERIYKEDPIRKKADKAKVPGWSCAKCCEFYSIAFKGNEEMIKKKINECSKHRGKFNPERRNTPPGFWDVNMPQTPDTYDCRND